MPRRHVSTRKLFITCTWKAHRPQNASTPRIKLIPRVWYFSSLKRHYFVRWTTLRITLISYQKTSSLSCSSVYVSFLLLYTFTAIFFKNKYIHETRVFNGFTRWRILVNHSQCCSQYLKNISKNISKNVVVQIVIGNFCTITRLTLETTLKYSNFLIYRISHICTR